MVDEYIRKADVLNLPQSIERNLRGEIVERSIDVKDVEALKPADVVRVVRCKDCKHVYCRIYHGWQEPIYTCTHLCSWWNSNNDLDVNPDDFCSYGGRKE